MENSGNIFSPEYFIIDEETHVVYRKEQFSSGNIPREFIVRDMRFTKQEIIEMCQKTNFKILIAKYVNAKDWTLNYSATDKKAKEILIICQK